ncbi:MAG: hypothetical protein ACI9J2_000634 [Saprospiraceae bacterium]|jgi:hypothetical protein
MFKIRGAIAAYGIEACEVLRRSINEVCAPDYDNEALLREWLSNKTQENVKQRIESDHTHAVVCLDGENKLVGFGMLAASGEVLLNYLVPNALYQENGRKLLEFMQHITKH